MGYRGRTWTGFMLDRFDGVAMSFVEWYFFVARVGVCTSCAHENFVILIMIRGF